MTTHIVDNVLEEHIALMLDQRGELLRSLSNVAIVGSKTINMLLIIKVCVIMSLKALNDSHQQSDLTYKGSIREQ